MPTRTRRRDDMLDNEFLRRQLRVEFGANAIEPPAALAVRTSAGEIALGEFRGEDGIVREGLKADAVEKDGREARLGGRIEQINSLAGNGFTHPACKHSSI